MHAFGSDVLWYGTPAVDWQRHALPIGNGLLGALVFGEPGTERLAYNEKSLWTGGPGAVGYGTDIPHEDQTAARVAGLRDIQRRIFESGPLPQSDPAVADLRIVTESVPLHGCYQPFADLLIHTGADPALVSGYRRSLDVLTGVATVSFEHQGGHHIREYFVSYPDNVLVGRLRTTGAATLDLRFATSWPDNRVVKATVDDDRFTLVGMLTNNGLRFESQLRVSAPGASITTGPDESLRVAGATEVTFVMSAGTDYSPSWSRFRGPDPHRAVTSRVDTAIAAGFDALLSRHRTDFETKMRRVRLDLGQDAAALPTDDALAAYRDGTATDGLRRQVESLAYQYGRYLLLSSSRAGGLPANLQGIWNPLTEPPWTCDYHNNINLEMCYWPATETNLLETAKPLDDWFGVWRERGKRFTARAMGIDAGQLIQKTPWAEGEFWDGPPVEPAWLTRHLWDYYNYTGDTAYLREVAYPALKCQAEFWMRALVTDPRDGTLVASPGISPEHGDLHAGGSYQQQVLADLFDNTIEAAELLGDETFRERALATRANLDPGLRIGRWGQLQEYKEDIDVETDPVQTHLNFLYALYPGTQLDPDRAPARAAAATKQLGRTRVERGWSSAWRIALHARLFDGESAYAAVANHLAAFTFDNLLDNWDGPGGATFQLDGNCGYTAGITQMLLQSHGDEIHVLPALPARWPGGSVEGLLAQGAVTVDATWSGGRTTSITLTAGRDAELVVRNPLFGGAFTITDTTVDSEVEPRVDGERITFTVAAGHRYVATPTERNAR